MYYFQNIDLSNPLTQLSLSLVGGWFMCELQILEITQPIWTHLNFDFDKSFCGILVDNVVIPYWK